MLNKLEQALPRVGEFIVRTNLTGVFDGDERIFADDEQLQLPALQAALGIVREHTTPQSLLEVLSAVLTDPDFSTYYDYVLSGKVEGPVDTKGVSIIEVLDQRYPLGLVDLAELLTYAVLGESALEEN